MPFDIANFAEGVFAAMAAERLKGTTNTVIQEDVKGEPPIKTSENYLEEIHLLLVSMLVWFKHQQSSQGDLFKYVTIYKSGFGPPYKPSHIGERMHFVLFSPYSPGVVLNCSGSGLGAFNVTLPVADWKVIDFPDNSQYLLDTTAPANSLVFWQRETNADVT